MYRSSLTLAARLVRSSFVPCSFLVRGVSSFGAADWTQQFTAQLSSLLGNAGALVDRSSGMRPSNALNGIMQGVAGLALCPLRGLHDRGVPGLIGGFLVGGIGLVVKPLTGILATASDASALLRSTFDPSVTVKKHALRRQRPPRIFRSSATTPSFASALKVYRAEESAGEELLSRVWRGRFFSDRYVRHEEAVDPYAASDKDEARRRGAAERADADAQLSPFVLVLTDVRLCCLRNDYARYCELVWSIRIRDVVGVTRVVAPGAGAGAGAGANDGAAGAAGAAGADAVHGGARIEVDVHHFPEMVAQAPRLSALSGERVPFRASAAGGDGGGVERDVFGSNGGIAALLGIALRVQRIECSAEFGASLVACFGRSQKELAGAVHSYKVW